MTISQSLVLSQLENSSCFLQGTLGLKGDPGFVGHQVKIGRWYVVVPDHNIIVVKVQVLLVFYVSCNYCCVLQIKQKYKDR